MSNDLDPNTLSSPEDYFRAFEQMESGQPETVVSAETPAPKADAQKGEQNEDGTAHNEPQKAEQGHDDKEDALAGVATKDGNHVIPYSVLKSERERARRAEQEVREAQARVSALEAKLSSGNQGANPGESARTDPQTPTADALSPEDLAALKEDFPTVYKALMAAGTTIRTLEAKLKPVEDSVRNVEAERQRSAAETVQDAIDSVPKLAHIQATNPQAFELAKQFDATLRQQAAWGDVPLSERFAKVAEMVESVMGAIELPGNKGTAPSAGDLAKAAKDKAAAAAKADLSQVPISLSEFPAGQHAAQDEREAVERLSHHQLAEKFASMSPDEMDAYLLNL